MNKKKIFLFLAFIFSLVFLDLYTKYLVEKKLVLPEKDYQQKFHFHYQVNYGNISDDKETYLIKEIVILKNRFTFFYTRNYNIGFSILSFLKKYFNPQEISIIIKCLQSIILIFILTYFFIIKMNFFFAFTFIIAGGIGNNFDRFYRGYVVDFIKWSFPELPWTLFNPWPIFNLADIWVSLGGILLFWGIMIEKKTNIKN